MPVVPHWAFEALGVAPTDDASTIRRAYARRLKLMRPEDDPDAFQHLRTARTVALAALTARQAASEDGEAPPRAETPAGDDTERELGPAPIVEPFEVAQSAAPPPRRETIIVEDDPVPAPPAPPRIVVADEMSDATADLADAEATPAAQHRRRVIEIAPLEESTGDWDAADKLKTETATCLSPLRHRRGVIDPASYETILRRAAMLPSGPRREVEALCLQTLTSGWRAASGGFDRRRVELVLPLLRRADERFGWGRDDAVVVATLGPRDADALALMLDEASNKDQSAKRPLPLRMRPSDARAYLAHSPAQLAVHKDTLERGTMPWRLRGTALIAPHIWAYRRRLWVTAVLFYAAAATPAVILMTQRPKPGVVPISLSLLLFAAVLAASGLLADRIVFHAACRTVRRADRRCLYDRAQREAYLTRRGSPVGIWALCLLGLSLGFVLFPYSTLLFVFDIR